MEFSDSILSSSSSSSEEDTMFPPNIQEDGDITKNLPAFKAATMESVAEMSAFVYGLLGAMFRSEEEAQRTGQPRGFPSEGDAELVQDLSVEWINFLIIHRSWLKTTETVTIDKKQKRKTTLCPGSHIFSEISRAFYVANCKEAWQTHKDAQRLLDDGVFDIPDDCSFIFATQMVESRTFPPDLKHWIARYKPPKRRETAQEIEERAARLTSVIPLTQKQIAEQERKKLEEDPYHGLAEELLLDFPVEKKVVLFTQKELIFTIRMITHRLRSAGYQPYIGHLINAVLFRHGEFVSRMWGPAVLDDPFMREERLVLKRDPKGGPPTEQTVYVVNRDYLFFSYYYLEPLASRLYLHTKFTSPHYQANFSPDTISPERKAAVLRWIKETVLPSLGTDTLDEVWQETCDELFEFSGDYDWFKYRYPRDPTSVNTMLRKLRPVIAQGYMIQRESSMENIIHGIGERFSSNLFAAQAIGKYIWGVTGRNWWEIFMVPNDGIHHYFDKFVQEEEMHLTHIGLAAEGNHPREVEPAGSPPLLLEVFSNYGIWHGQGYWNTDNLFDATVAWFSICDRLGYHHIDGYNIKAPILDAIFRPVVLYENLKPTLYGKSLN